MHLMLLITTNIIYFLSLCIFISTWYKIIILNQYDKQVNHKQSKRTLIICDPGPQNQGSTFSKLRFIQNQTLNIKTYVKAKCIRFPLMYGLLWSDNIWKSGIWGCKKNLNIEKIIF